jgi:hypothetical protein
MSSESLTWGAWLDGGPNGSDTMPFSGENAVLVVYGGHPSLGRRCVSNLSPRASTHCGRGHEGSRV